MASNDTKERIVLAAERLFADSGFAATSLRQLTEAAAVNLAAVNYHFGSKRQLIEEVLRRRLDVLNGRRSELMQELSTAHPLETLPLSKVLEAFILPALEISADAPADGSPFIKVLAHAYVEYRDGLRELLSQRYGEVNKSFFHAIAAHLKPLPDQVIYWRIDFMIGAVTYAMADFGVTKKPKGISDDAFRRQAASELVTFAMAGLKAPPDPASPPPQETSAELSHEPR